MWSRLRRFSTRSVPHLGHLTPEFGGEALRQRRPPCSHCDPHRRPPSISAFLRSVNHEGARHANLSFVDGDEIHGRLRVVTAFEPIQRLIEFYYQERER
jgi:hypothetical protein